MIQDESAAKRLVTQRRLKAAYEHVFLSMEGKIVLGDLAKRCHALTSTFADGPDGDRFSAFSEGQRTVFLHIQTVLRKSDEEIRNIAEEDWI